MIQMSNSFQINKWIKRNRREIIILLIILAAASALRLTRLGYQSEWNDEAISAMIAGGTTRQILTNQFHSLHPPVYYLVLHFWQGVFGDSDFVLRLPSALMGIAGIVAIYLLGRLLFKPNTGLWAAAITAFMPFHLFYSQEMRSYSQMFLLSTLAVLCQVKIWQSKERLRWWVAYLAVALLGMYTHYLFILILGALACFFVLQWLITGQGPSWKEFLLAHAAMVILYSPIVLWLQDQLSQSSDYWIQQVSWALFFSVPLAFTVGQFLDPMALQVGYGIVLMVLITTMLQAIRGFRQKSSKKFGLTLLLLIYWLPILTIFAVSIFWTPLTLARLMIVAVPGLYLLLAWGATIPKERIINAILVILLICIGLLADYNWLFNPRYAKPPAREAAYFLQQQASPDEIIVYTSDSGFRLFWRYAPQLRHRLFLEDNDNPQVRPDVFRMIGGDIITFADPLSDTFWLVLHQDFDVEKQEAIFQRFDQHYTRLADYTVGGIRMYQYRSTAGMD